MNYEKIATLFQKEEFQKKSENCKTMDDFQMLFSDFGVEMTHDEVVELISQIAEQKQKVDKSEINESDLENVSGGLVISTTLFCIGVGVACCGTAAVSAYVSYNALKWSHK